MNERIGLRIVSALVLIAVIAGIGMFAYRAGMAQGLATNVSELPQFKDLPKDGVPPIYRYDGYGYGYGMPFHGAHFGFGFGIFGFLFTLFLFFVALRAMRFLFWGPRWGHHGGHGWGKPWEGSAPPMFDEWHKKAHGEQPEEKKE